MKRKEVPITFAISFNLWQKIFQHHTSAEMTKEHLSSMHKKLQSDFEKTSLTLPNHITFLDVSNKHHVEHLHQNMLHVSSVIVQTHGQQTVVLMPPISKQHPYHDLFNSTGQFLFNKEINLSASDSVLNNESRLAHATLYSVHLNPGDILLVPANWFIYRKSISPSISMSLNCLSGDTWPLFCSQAEFMRQKHDEHLIQETHVINTWAKMEMQNHSYNKRGIIHACKKIQTAISDATQLVLNLSCMKLSSLPDVIFRIAHLETLDLSYNKFTFLSLNCVRHLVSLNLRSNELTSFSLNHMEKLESLNLVNNRLISFSLSHMPQLTSLNLRCNELTSFSLDYTEKLTLLDLEDNQLTSFSLSHMKNLALLYLSNNQLSSFLSCDLPNVKHIDLRNNYLSHLGPNCINSINTHQHITLDLRGNPLSNEGRTQIQKNLLQRLGDNVTYYPILHPLIEHINHNTMTYKDFIALLFSHNIPPSENNCLICPITHANPSQVIVLMSGNKCYKIYDADALIQWIRTQSQSEELSEEIHNPYTRELLTFENLISAKELCVLQYLKQELGLASTENIDTIPDHKS